MTTFPFTPSYTIAPSFQPTLDGEVYTCTVTWNLFGQRYYLNCFDSSGNLVFTVAISETAPSLPINSLVWDGVSQIILVTTSLPHGYQIGSTLELTIEGASPDAFNGTQSMLVTGASTLTFLSPNYPGSLVGAGNLSYLVSLCAGYFSSTLVYRNGQFEVSP